MALGKASVVRSAARTSCAGRLAHLWPAGPAPGRGRLRTTAAPTIRTLQFMPPCQYHRRGHTRWLTPPGGACNPPGAPCRSVVETIKIMTETLEALFDMRLPIPPGVVRCLTEGVDLAMQK